MGTIVNVLRPDNQPQNITGACCVDGECSITTESDCSDLGGNYLGNGTTCDDVDCEHGACCDTDTGECTVTILEECDGEFQGYGTVCDPNPCPQPPPEGACCIDGVCSITTESECEGSGGTYQGDDTTCEGVDCTQGACCNEGDCTVITHADCIESGGVYQGDGTDCDPDPCPLVPCDCVTPFGAFDGSGRKFRSKTTTVTGTQSWSPSPNVWEITWESTRMESCNGDCSCSGSGTVHIENPPDPELDCTLSTDGCGTTFLEGEPIWPSVGGNCKWTASPEFCIGNATISHPSACCVGGVGCCADESHTATTRTTTYDCEEGSGPCHQLNITIIETLSDECFEE